MARCQPVQARDPNITFYNTFLGVVVKTTKNNYQEAEYQTFYVVDEILVGLIKKIPLLIGEELSVSVRKDLVFNLSQ